ncbi:MAG: hypothetical protein ACM3N5_08585 [Candidatus Eiseniibacteriota bacterium]
MSDPFAAAASRIGEHVDQLVAQAVVVLAALALAVLGVLSLAIAACVALAEVWGLPFAALATGLTLLVLALGAWLVARERGARADAASSEKPQPSAAMGAAELGAAVASGVQARPKEAAIIALVAGLVAGSSPGLRRSLERLID